LAGRPSILPKNHAGGDQQYQCSRFGPPVLFWSWGFRRPADRRRAQKSKGNQLDFRKKNSSYRQAVGVCVALLALPESSFAQIDPTTDDTLTFYGTSTTLYDSNPFRLPSTVSTEDRLGKDHKSDVTEVAGIGVHLDKNYAQQEIVGDASYSYYWYQTFDYLNASATNFDLAWKWHLTPWISGTVSGTRREIPADYDFYRNVEARNYYNQEEYKLRMEANPWGGWRFIIGTGAYISSNTSSGSDIPKSKQFFVDGGLGYLTLSGSRIQFVDRYSTGNYAQSNTSVFANARDFSENNSEIQYISQPESVVGLKLAGGFVSRKNQNFSARDYDGWTADSTVTWLSTEKLTLSGRVRRSFSAYQDQYFTNYSREDFTFSPQWDFSPKVSVSGTVGYSRYKFGGYSVSTLDESRTDQLGIYSADATWIPSRLFTLKLSASNRVRDSSFGIENLDYKSNLISLTAILNY
jgi:hypothetical protein